MNPISVSYVVEWRNVFNDANVTEWRYWHSFKSYEDAYEELEYSYGMLEEVGYQGGLFESLEDRSIQYRISKIITKVDERNGVSYYQDFTDCNLDDAFDALLDYSNRQKRIKKDSDIYWNLIAAAEKIAEKHLGQCR